MKRKSAILDLFKKHEEKARKIATEHHTEDIEKASVERVFSVMNLVKNKLRNSMSDDLLNDCLVTFIERDVFLKVSEDDIVEAFMAKERRRVT